MVLSKPKLIAGAVAVAVLAVGGIAFVTMSGSGDHKSETAGAPGGQRGPGGPGATPVAATPALAGSSWTAGTAAGTNALKALIYGGSFVAAGSNGRVAWGYTNSPTDASDLIVVDARGHNVAGDAKLNPAGFTIHSCIHDGRPDVGCVLHTHTRAGVAVSAQKCGVLPISQQSTFVLGSLAYHDYEGVALRDDEKPRLQADLGDANYLMLRNHGLLTIGKTIPEAFLAMYTFENTCRIQIDAQAGGELTMVNPKILDGIANVMKVATGGQGAALAWPSLLRKLDRMDPSYKS